MNDAPLAYSVLEWGFKSHIRVANQLKEMRLVAQASGLFEIRSKGRRIRPGEKKIAAITRFPRPTTTKVVQNFLGYFRKFVPHYALITRSLLQLLRDETKFVFGAEKKKGSSN